LNTLPGGKPFTRQFNRLDNHLEQQAMLRQFFQQPNIYQELAA